jgi:hypothetical protein
MFQQSRGGLTESKNIERCTQRQYAVVKSVPVLFIFGVLLKIFLFVDKVFMKCFFIPVVLFSMLYARRAYRQSAAKGGAPVLFSYNNASRVLSKAVECYR